MDAKVILKGTILRAMQVPLIGRALIAYYDRKQVFRGWNRLHPYDRINNVRTSGATPSFLLGPDAAPYGAAQPSIIRKALAMIPDPQHCQFVDIGCGKGRALLIATEFGFRAITGVELSPALSRIARSNAAVFARAQPNRTRVDIVSSDGLVFKLPEEPLVVFLYRPFHRAATQTLLDHIEASQKATPRNLYIVCYNPIWANLFDASTVLERRYAAQIAYDPSETGYGPDESDGVIIWQNRGNPNPLPPGNPNARIKIIAPDWLAAVDMEH